MKHVFVACATLIFFTQCNNNTKKTDTPVADTTVTKDTLPPPAPVDSSTNENAAGFPASFNPGKIFTADKADLHEQLSVQQLSEKRIAYEVKMENGECPEFVFRGVATLKEGDAESDTDEKGNGFFVAEYLDESNGQCTLYIRIGGDEGYTNRARFILADCKKACNSKTESEPLLLKSK